MTPYNLLHVVLLAFNTVGSSLDIALGLSSFNLSLALGVLLLAGALPLGRASEVTNLDRGAY